VRVGDAAVFERPFAVQGRRRVAKAMDDRIGCAVLVETLRRLERTPHEVHFVFSVQEETTLSGARTAAYGIEPDMAIAVDVTGTGDTPESRPMAVELGKGPAVKVQDAGMIAHPTVREWLVRAAEAAGVPYQMEVLERGTTDAAAMQLVRAGVPSGCLSIPCRYIHTPSEMVDGEDVEGAVRLLLHALL
jgi:putative aminopeptidase FrvX